MRLTDGPEPYVPTRIERQGSAVAGFTTVTTLKTNGLTHRNAHQFCILLSSGFRASTPG